MVLIGIYLCLVYFCWWVCWGLKKKKFCKFENLWGFVIVFGGDGGIWIFDLGFGLDVFLVGECFWFFGYVF